MGQINEQPITMFAIEVECCKGVFLKTLSSHIRLSQLEHSLQQVDCNLWNIIDC